MLTLARHWEWWLIGVGLLGIVVYVFAYEYFLMTATRRWIQTLPDGSERWHLRGYDAKPRPNVRRA